MQNQHNENYTEVTGVLLAGGKSRRMGQDKAVLEVNGQTLFLPALALLRRFFTTNLIAGERADLARPEIPAIPDRYPGSSLGGIHTGLAAAGTPWVFVIPCDMPFPDDRIVEMLLQRRQGVDAVVPRTPAGFEPVFALYHKSCLPHIESMLISGNHRIYDLYQHLRVRYLDWLAMPPGWRRRLTNINTPEDLARAEEGSMGPPLVSFVANSGTGKTTLLEKLIAELKARGFRVGAIKHDAHRFNIDHPGKDSWRLTQAGADTTLITSSEQIALMKKILPQEEPSLNETVARYCSDLDIVLTEGFKRTSVPKIEVHRKELNQPLLCRGEFHDLDLIAVASDCPLELDVPVFDINDGRGLCDLIVQRFLS